MLQLAIALSPEGWDDEKEEFVEPKTVVLTLEHSLVSISDWEAKWCKPFLTKTDKTDEEIIDYVKCMTLTPNVDPDIYNYLTNKHITQIYDYINAPMTATTFSSRNEKPSREIITSELIYYWMIALNIPTDFRTWHLNRLLTLIRVCNVKNAPPKKMSQREIMSRNAALNEARRKQFNSMG